MNFERSGGLRLCSCEHTRAHHEPRPAWFSWAGSSEGARNAPLETGCFFCSCPSYSEGPDQGTPGAGLKGAAFVARRRELGLPEMRLGAMPAELEG